MNLIELLNNEEQKLLCNSLSVFKTKKERLSALYLDAIQKRDGIQPMNIGEKVDMKAKMAHLKWQLEGLLGGKFSNSLTLQFIQNTDSDTVEPPISELQGAAKKVRISEGSVKRGFLKEPRIICLYELYCDRHSI
jgi:hypothetical protein